MAIRNVFGNPFWSPALWQNEPFTPSLNREFNRMQRVMDRMFDELMTAPERMALGAPVATAAQLYAPACDITESASHYLISLDVPGIDRSKIHLEVKDTQLMITGERKREHHETTEEGRVVSVERNYGAFSRALMLPSDCDTNRIEAAYEDGVLRIAIPKTEAAKGRVIPVLEHKGGFFQKLLGRPAIEEKKAEKAA